MPYVPPDMTSDGCVVVTGASAGVGRATAIALGKRGYNVGLVARGKSGLEGARADVEAAGGHAVVLPTDVADPDAVDSAADRAEAAFGPIGAWCNVAMATLFSPLQQMSSEEFRRVTEVTYLGQVYGTMSALRRMSKHGRGTIVSVGSALGYQGLPLQSAYCGAKAALRGFNESVRCELLHAGEKDIRISSVILPAVNTPQFNWARNRLSRRPQPAPPIFQPEVPAEAVVRAVHTGEREIVVGKSSLQIILGSLFAPGILEKIMAFQGFKAQQDNPQRLERPDNLFTPLDDDEDFGAHGRFDDRSRGSALQVGGSTVRGGMIGLGLATVAASGFLGFALGKRRRR